MKTLLFGLLLVLFASCDTKEERPAVIRAREDRKVYWRATLLTDSATVRIIKADSAFIEKDVIKVNDLTYKLLTRVK